MKVGLRPQTLKKVLEERRPVTITYFDHVDVPVSVALQLDASGSMIGEHPALRAARHPQRVAAAAVLAVERARCTRPQVDLDGLGWRSGSLYQV